MGNILNLYSHLMIFLYLCLYVYVDVIVDITPQLITLNQKSKIRHVSQEQTFKRIDTYKNSFVFVPKSRSPIPKVTLGTGFQSVKSTFVFKKKR
jgi:hypothetical protein